MKPEAVNDLQKDGDSSGATALKGKTVRGALISLGSQPVSIGIQLLSTMILARLLTPADYGIFAMAATVTALAGAFGDFGLGAATVQDPNLSHGMQSNFFWISMAIGCVITVFVSLTAPLAAWFYQDERAIWVTVALSTSFIITMLGSQHGALLKRKMQFGRIAIADISSKISAMACSVALAMAGMGYWALVFGSLCGIAVNNALLAWLSGWIPGRFQRGLGLRRKIPFGVHMTLSGLMNYLKANLASVVIGKSLGAEPLGIYSRSTALVMLPFNALSGAVNVVAFPALSRLQSRHDEFRSFLRQMTTGLSLVSIPLVAILALTADELVLVALGPAWEKVSPIFRALAIGGFVQTFTASWSPALLALAKTKRLMILDTASAILTILSIMAAIRWGSVGVALGVSAAALITAILAGVFGFRNTPVDPLDLLASSMRPLFATIGATMVTMFASSHFNVTPPLAILTLKILVFALTYLLLLACIPGLKKDIRLVRSLVDSLRRSKTSSQSASPLKPESENLA